MVSIDSVHADTTTVCTRTLKPEDGDEQMNEHGHPQTCGTDMQGDQHATYVKHPRGKDRNGTALQHRFEQSALRWDCPDCGQQTWTCPVCADEDGGHGYFRGDSTGQLLACHNCNPGEVRRNGPRQRTGGRLHSEPRCLDNVPTQVDRDRNGGR